MSEGRDQRSEGRDWRGMVFCLLPSVFCLLSFSGCSEIKTPTASEAVTHPFGTAAPFPRGTLKAKVLQDWGNPDVVIPHGADELGNIREEWIYHGRMQSLPIDYEYVSRTKHLFFEGNNLTRWSTEEPSSPEQK